MGSTARMVLVFLAISAAGCSSHLPAHVNQAYYSGGKLTEPELVGGNINTPFTRYLDQRDAERRVAREIVDELGRREAAQ